MTPDEINAAIAESVGWDDIAYSGARDRFDGYSPRGTIREEIPNYHGSLDSIVPVVRALDSDDKEIVIEWLMDITKGFTGLATPPEWCEAYLQWKGLWK